MSFERLDDLNFELYAAKYYENPDCVSLLEFHDDLKRIKYLRRLFNRFMNKGELQSRLIITHMTILRNLFGDYPTVRMLFLKIDPLHHGYLKAFLIFLGVEFDVVEGIGVNGDDIHLRDIEEDEIVRELLAKSYEKSA